jgi:hypothetical protein
MFRVLVKSSIALEKKDLKYKNGWISNRFYVRRLVDHHSRSMTFSGF